MIAFILSMPNRGSWNGRWSGENDIHVIIKTERSVPKDVIGKSFWYNWDDGWSACVSVEKVDCKTGNLLRKKSRGFCGYDWMVDSIIKKGVIEYVAESIELVVKIDKDLYEMCKDCLDAEDNIKDIIANGTPLPKRHGRLVDISPYEKYEKNCDPWKLGRYVGKNIRMTETVSLPDIPTVIEADIE